MNADLRLLRVVYVSQQVEPANSNPELLTAILEHASNRNAQCDITGVLACIGGHFLQALEGPPAEVDRLVARIRHDTRHRNLHVLMRIPVTSRSFAGWSMAVVECSSDRNASSERIADLVVAKALAAELDVRSLFQAVCLPAPRAVAGGVERHTSPLPLVVVASASDIWSVALLSSLAGQSNAVVQRIGLRSPASATRSTLLEYVDIATAPHPPVRVLAITGQQFDDGLLSVLLDRPTLITMLVSTSDASNFPFNMQSLFARNTSWAGSTPVMLVCNTSPEQLEIMARQLRTFTEGAVSTLIGRVADTPAIWAAVHRQIASCKLATLPDELAIPTSPRSEGRLAASRLMQAPQDALARQLSEFLATVPGGLCTAVAAPREGVIVASAFAASKGSHTYATALWDSIAPLWKLLEAMGETDGPEEVGVSTTTRLLNACPVAGCADRFLLVESTRDESTLASLALQAREFARCGAGGSKLSSDSPDKEVPAYRWRS